MLGAYDRDRHIAQLEARVAELSVELTAERGRLDAMIAGEWTVTWEERDRSWDAWNSDRRLIGSAATARAALDEAIARGGVPYP